MIGTPRRDVQRGEWDRQRLPHRTGIRRRTRAWRQAADLLLRQRWQVTCGSPHRGDVGRHFARNPLPRYPASESRAVASGCGERARQSAPVEVENTERPRIRLLLARLARRRAIRGKRPGMLSSRRVALVVNGGLQGFHIEPVHAAAAETATG